jgi:hypothetical protein
MDGQNFTSNNHGSYDPSNFSCFLMPKSSASLDSLIVSVEDSTAIPQIHHEVEIEGFPTFNV